MIWGFKKLYNFSEILIEKAILSEHEFKKNHKIPRILKTSKPSELGYALSKDSSLFWFYSLKQIIKAWLNIKN